MCPEASRTVTVSWRAVWPRSVAVQVNSPPGATTLKTGGLHTTETGSCSCDPICCPMVAAAWLLTTIASAGWMLYRPLDEVTVPLRLTLSPSSEAEHENFVPFFSLIPPGHITLTPLTGYRDFSWAAISESRLFVFNV